MRRRPHNRHKAALVAREDLRAISLTITNEIVEPDNAFLGRVGAATLQNHLPLKFCFLVDQHCVVVREQIVFVIAKQSPWVYQLLGIVSSHFLFDVSRLARFLSLGSCQLILI